MNSRRTPSLDDLEPEQRAALIAFRDKYGRTWKTELNDRWLNGKDASEPNGHLLRQIRNRQGPTWLNNLKRED